MLPIVKSPHAKVRRNALKALRIVRESLGLQVDTWKAETYVYDGNHYRDADGKIVGRRPRSLMEYPENNAGVVRDQADRLRSLARYLESIAGELDQHAAYVERWTQTIAHNDPRRVRTPAIPRDELPRFYGGTAD